MLIHGEGNSLFNNQRMGNIRDFLFLPRMDEHSKSFLKFGLLRTQNITIFVIISGNIQKF
jgi:hypothetical protein